MQLKDLETVHNRLEKVKKTSKSGDKSSIEELGILEKVVSHLESSRNIRSISEEIKNKVHILKPLQLLTSKPVLYVCNVDEKSVVDGNNYVSSVMNLAERENAQVISLAAGIESEIQELESYDERKIFLDDLGIDEPGSSKLISAVYDLLDLHTYFTAGPKEVRAWTIPKGSLAPQAAGVIHSDFEKGFIKAEVISYEDFNYYKTELKVREAGKMRIEGKEYEVKSGDIIHFLFNV